MKTHFIVQSAVAKMPHSCWGRYRRVGVLEVPEGVSEVAMISERCTEVVQVVETWEGCNVGTTERCAYEKALTAAHALADKLNAQREEEARIEAQRQADYDQWVTERFGPLEPGEFRPGHPGMPPGPLWES